MRRTVPPSAEIEARIEQLLAVGVGENPRETLSELAKLGARLIIQRAVEDEFEVWLGRARYERRPEYQRGLRNYDSGLRNGFSARKVQTGEGELEIEIPQVREAAATFASKLFPRQTKLLRTEPLNYGSAAYTRTARGGGTTMGVARPAYDGSGGSGHSLDEISVQGGPSNGNIVELGWNVSTAQYPNADPHLFVFHWIDWAPTCYDTCGWHQYSSTYAPGMDLSALVGREVYVGWVYYQGNWWAWFDNQWLGYFPGSEWKGAYTSNSLIQWFGEVSSANGIPPHTDMGTGTFPLAPASARNATLCDVDPSVWVCFYRDQQATANTFPAYYKSIRSGFGEVRYGGPGE